MRIPAWVRHLAFHPVVVAIARISLAVIALAFTGGVGYIASINGTIANVEEAQTLNKAATDLRFQGIEARITAGSVATEALSRNVDLGREDRVQFQNDTTQMLRMIVTQNQTILANQAASVARMDNFDDRLKRIENGAHE